jgi:hypothetical protein
MIGERGSIPDEKQWRVEMKIEELHRHEQELTLEQAEAAQGGMTVQIGTVNSSVSTTDGSSLLSGDVLRKLVSAVLEAL